MKIRTRIAPSPTGEDLHIGNAYTALVNYVFAKKHGGQFIIRIEDTDRSRLVPGSEKRILNSLEWLGITHDEGPFRQSERLEIYKKLALDLIEKGYAYWCSCTPERLSDMRKKQEEEHKAPMYDGLCREKNLTKGATIRLKVPREGDTSFHDVIRGDISFENKLIDDQVILKSDGFPTYHLGVVVDDHLMDISHIIRGEEWISSTPKHILLYQFFGWEPPVFAHMPLLRNPDKSKLSKRKNPVWVSWFREQGFLPEAMRNYLATMAWAFPGGREIFSTEEMIQEFKLENVQTTAPIFDIEKLKWMNGEYIRSKSNKDLKTLLYQYVTMLTHEHEAIVDKVLPLVKERMRTLNEFWTLAGFFFERPSKKENHPLLLSVLESCDWNHDAMEKAIREAAEKANMKAKDVFMELRIAVTGKTVGPPLLESLEILGREETLVRL